VRSQKFRVVGVVSVEDEGGAFVVVHEGLDAAGRSMVPAVARRADTPARSRDRCVWLWNGEQAFVDRFTEERRVHRTVAKKLIVELTDDIDGSVIVDGAGESIEFSVDGVDYAIDLKDKNAKQFRKALGYYIEHATKVGGRKRGGHTSAVRAAAEAEAATTKSSKRDPEQTRAIREWANSNGYQVSARGRIPVAAVEAFDAAH
jgi:hypothetical protein